MEINNATKRSFALLFMIFISPLSAILSVLLFKFFTRLWLNLCLLVAAALIFVFSGYHFTLPLIENIALVKSTEPTADFLSLVNDFADGYFLIVFALFFVYVPVLNLMMKYFFDRPAVALNKALFSSEQKTKYATLNTGTKQPIGDYVLMGLNNETQKPFSIDRTKLNNHTLTIGTTGSGKTNSIMNIAESLIVNRKGFVYVDIKGSVQLRDGVRDFAQKQGVKFKCFSVVDKSCKYNPFMHGEQTAITEKLMALREWENEFYRTQAYSFFQSLIMLMQFSKITINLSNVLKHIDPLMINKLRFDKAGQLNQKFRSDLVAKSKQEHIQILQSELEVLVMSEKGHLLMPADEDDYINIEESMRGSEIVYFLLQPLRYFSFTELLTNVILRDIQTVLSNALINPFQENHIFIDEPFSVNTSKSIKLFLQQGRSTNTAFHLITQAPSDIEIIDKSIIKTVINNVNLFNVHRLNSPEDVELVANIIGTEKTNEVTMQADREGTGESKGTIKKVDEFTVHPNIIKVFPTGKGIIINKSNGINSVVSFRKSKIDT